MKLVPLSEMTPPMWYTAWNAMYDGFLGDHMGVDPVLLAQKPTLEQFYDNIMNAHQAGTFEAWAIMKGGEYKGHTLLDKRVGEWEVATVLIDPTDWGSGTGVRATLHALKHAFEVLKAEWVVAFTQGKDARVVENLHRGGFRPFMNFHVLDSGTWNARWRARRDR